MNDLHGIGCAGCRTPLDFDFTMAFQPILDLSTQTVFAHEALVRGLQGEGAATILGRVDETNRFAFDQLCRVKAVELAFELGLPAVSINFMPNAVYDPANCLRTTLDAARRTGTPLNRIILEVTEGEKVEDAGHLRRILETYKRSGLVTALDDFGAGYSGLNLLADFQPDILKLDMALTRGIDTHRPRQAIVAAAVGLCRALSITPIAEGVETEDEMRTLRDIGIDHMQGYLFAKPRIGAPAPISWAALPSAQVA
ncbi:EAL domain-containing protein [Rubellimicrobium rubrum]|uniref:EAL domain-containing protein n=1 Tax=Rubellimicrobium rubrum TaxID=2585369 RepID=A0A5C4N7H9_9RHOB|nr:EAL domain-containing protein [Rubellimicrobium rubrum]TNC53011.1 EAL domain-containing protein [Rubellimicrobium rubrum]